MSPLRPVRVLVISHWSAKPSPHASSLGSPFGGGWPQEVLGANCPEMTHGESQPLALESGFPMLRCHGKHPVDGNYHIHSAVPQFGVGSKRDAWAASLWRVLPCALSPGLKSPGWFCSYEQPEVTPGRSPGLGGDRGSVVTGGSGQLGCPSWAPWLRLRHRFCLSWRDWILKCLVSDPTWKNQIESCGNQI